MALLPFPFWDHGSSSYLVWGRVTIEVEALKHIFALQSVLQDEKGGSCLAFRLGFLGRKLNWKKSPWALARLSCIVVVLCSGRTAAACIVLQSLLTCIFSSHIATATNGQSRTCGHMGWSGGPLGLLFGYFCYMESCRCLLKEAWTSISYRKKISSQKFELQKKDVDSLCGSWKMYEQPSEDQVVISTM